MSQATMLAMMQMQRAARTQLGMAGRGGPADPALKAAPRQEPPPSKRPEPEDYDFWTGEQVRDCLVGAYRVLRQAPLTHRDIPASLRSAMPAHMRLAIEMDYPDTDEYPLRDPKPSARAIEQAYQALPWLLEIEDVRDRKVIAARLMGLPWKLIAAWDGRSRQFLYSSIYCVRLAHLAADLNREQIFFVSGFTQVTKYGRLDKQAKKSTRPAV